MPTQFGATITEALPCWRLKSQISTHRNNLPATCPPPRSLYGGAGFWLPEHSAEANKLSENQHMTTSHLIKPAISRSISHDEIVFLVVDDVMTALESIDNDENVTDLGYALIDNGDIDCWGKRFGEEFRLLIRSTSLVGGAA